MFLLGACAGEPRPSEASPALGPHPERLAGSDQDSAIASQQIPPASPVEPLRQAIETLLTEKGWIVDTAPAELTPEQVITDPRPRFFRGIHFEAPSAATNKSENLVRSYSDGAAYVSARRPTKTPKTNPWRRHLQAVVYVERDVDSARSVAQSMADQWSWVIEFLTWTQTVERSSSGRDLAVTDGFGRFDRQTRMGRFLIPVIAPFDLAQVLVQRGRFIVTLNLLQPDVSEEALIASALEILTIAETVPSAAEIPGLPGTATRPATRPAIR